MVVAMPRHQRYRLQSSRRLGVASHPSSGVRPGRCVIRSEPDLVKVVPETVEGRMIGRSAGTKIPELSTLLGESGSEGQELANYTLQRTAGAPGPAPT